MAQLHGLERYGMMKGLLQGIEQLIELKFGPVGLTLMPALREEPDLEVLQCVLAAIRPAASVNEVSKLIPLRMPQHEKHLTGFERLGLRRGRLEGIEALLDLKFGAKGLDLMPLIRHSEVGPLEGILFGIKAAASLDDVRRLLPPPPPTAAADSQRGPPA